MHLDQRGYAYETYREGGRVCRRYVGSGKWAACAVRLDEHDREQDKEARQSERKQIETIQSSAEALDAFCRASRALLKEAFTASGYHQHKRGEWRKQRANPMGKSTSITKNTTGDTANLVTSNKEHFELLKRANNGDKTAAVEALAIVKGLPEEGPMLDLVASLSTIASERLIQSITDNELRRAGFRRRLEVMRDELAGPSPSVLELHLAERIALCALEVARMESVYASNASSSTKVWEACGRQLDAAHRRHLSAVKALAEVRRLRLPTVQLNIGENQVNVGSVNGPVVASNSTS